ncbi:MAG: hypothetical protein Q8K93_27635 [Reyranella sp.]|uniref:hypothetical protein n=1 Tax=Reyranella sp. TaxID=1929291 RepID=UPI002731348D|nr:hypothetical protein [Reyranella sp.]MDP1965965.1 hypothetical protein [Reyranella sp.]MDP2374339.1 hypothetical protein [Reyranella sp.]
MPLLATVATGIVSSYQPPDPVGVGSPHYLTLMMLGGAMPDDSALPDSLVTDKGKALLEAARATCGTEMRALAKQQGINAENAFVEPIDKVEARLTRATDIQPVRIPVPVLLGTGLADTTLSPRRQYAAVVALCSARSPLLWKTYPGATHNGSVSAAFPDALAFSRSVMAGETPRSNCSGVPEPGVPGAPGTGIPFNE